MPTARTPIIRFPKAPYITPLAIDLFEKMQRCRDSERWWALHRQLHDEVKARPWEWPCIMDDDDDSGGPDNPWARRMQRRRRALETVLRGRTRRP